jgi:ribosomal silencing factor RsfS
MTLELNASDERGIDVRAVPLAGRSDLADALVFVTGRALPHMRKMADTVARAVRKRHRERRGFRAEDEELR